MIDRDMQLKIQAFADGELAEAEAREIAALIARDREAAALHTELKNTRRALVGAEQGVTLPESREFYWSKIRRELEKLDPQPAPRPAPALWQLISRVLRPVSAFAVIVLLGMVVFNQTGGVGGGTELLVASSDMDAITYRDETDGTTYVWFSDSSENEVAEDEDDITLN